MKTSLYITFSFCLLLMASCKKKPLPGDDSSTESPVFYANCQVNGFPLKLEAGANDYYMNSSYFQDSTTHVYVYKAELKQKNCTGNCSYALTILINDSQVSAPGGAMNVNSGLKIGTYRFNSNSLPPLGYMGKFTPVSPNLSGDTYSWAFDDGVSMNGYEVSRKLDPRLYSVTLNYQNAVCSTSHLNVFDVSNPLQTSISASPNPVIPGYSYKLQATPTGVGPYQYSWDFGDGTPLSGDPNPGHVYDKSGYYRVKLQLTDAQNNKCTSYYQLVASNNPTDCAANYKALFTPLPDTTALSAVTILITDASGKVSSSKDFVQPSGSSFQIISVDDYKDNDQGEPTKKIHIRFSCTLNNSSGPIVIKNGEAVIAVAYK